MSSAAAAPDLDPPAPGDTRPRSFLRLASHELRTPLNSILGFAQILGDEIHGPLGSAQYGDYARIIRDSGERLLGLVNQVLEIARLEGRMNELQRHPQAVGQVLAAVLAVLGDQFAQHHLTVWMDLGAGADTVLADERALRTVLANLLQQAAAASPEGAEICIRSLALGDRIDIVIEDQGEAAAQDRTEAGGLALMVCHTLVHAMEGSLTLETLNRPGQRARLSLPTG